MNKLLINETHDLNLYTEDRKYSSTHFTVDRQALYMIKVVSPVTAGLKLNIKLK